nr:hypothetical protein CFP56_53692 [Quercus suber]
MASAHTHFTNPFHGPHTDEPATFTTGSQLREDTWTKEFRHDSGLRAQSVREASECPLPIMLGNDDDDVEDDDVENTETTLILAGISSATQEDEHNKGDTELQTRAGGQDQAFQKKGSESDELNVSDEIKTSTFYEHVVEEEEEEGDAVRVSDGMRYRDNNASPEPWEHSNDTTQVNSSASLRTEDDSTLIVEGTERDTSPFTQDRSPLHGGFSPGESITQLPAYTDSTSINVPPASSNVHAASRRRRSTFTQPFVGRERFPAESNQQVGLTADEDDHDTILRAVDEGQLIGRAAEEAELRALFAETSGIRHVPPGGRRSSFASAIQDSRFDTQVVREHEARTSLAARVSSLGREADDMRTPDQSEVLDVVPEDGDTKIVGEPVPTNRSSGRDTPNHPTELQDEQLTPPDRYWAPNAISLRQDDSMPSMNVDPSQAVTTVSGIESAPSVGMPTSFTATNSFSDTAGLSSNVHPFSNDRAATNASNRQLIVTEMEVEPTTDESEEDQAITAEQSSQRHRSNDRRKSGTDSLPTQSPPRQLDLPMQFPPVAQPSSYDKQSSYPHLYEPTWTMTRRERSHRPFGPVRTTRTTLSSNEERQPLRHPKPRRQIEFVDDELRPLKPLLSSSTRDREPSESITPLLPPRRDNERNPRPFRESEELSQPRSPPEHRTSGRPASAFKRQDSNSGTERSVSFSEIMEHRIENDSDDDEFDDEDADQIPDQVRGDVHERFCARLRGVAAERIRLLTLQEQERAFERSLHREDFQDWNLMYGQGWKNFMETGSEYDYWHRPVDEPVAIEHLDPVTLATLQPSLTSARTANQIVRLENVQSNVDRERTVTGPNDTPTTTRGFLPRTWQARVPQFAKFVANVTVRWLGRWTAHFSRIFVRPSASDQQEQQHLQDFLEESTSSGEGASPLRTQTRAASLSVEPQHVAPAHDRSFRTRGHKRSQSIRIAPGEGPFGTQSLIEESKPVEEGTRRICDLPPHERYRLHNFRRKQLFVEPTSPDEDSRADQSSQHRPWQDIGAQSHSDGEMSDDNSSMISPTRQNSADPQPPWPDLTTVGGLRQSHPHVPEEVALSIVDFQRRQSTREGLVDDLGLTEQQLAWNTARRESDEEKRNFGHYIDEPEAKGTPLVLKDNDGLLEKMDPYTPLKRYGAPSGNSIFIAIPSPADSRAPQHDDTTLPELDHPRATRPDIDQGRKHVTTHTERVEASSNNTTVTLAHDPVLPPRRQSSTTNEVSFGNIGKVKLPKVEIRDSTNREPHQAKEVDQDARAVKSDSSITEPRNDAKSKRSMSKKDGKSRVHDDRSLPSEPAPQYDVDPFTEQEEIQAQFERDIREAQRRSRSAMHLERRAGESSSTVLHKEDLRTSRTDLEEGWSEDDTVDGRDTEQGRSQPLGPPDVMENQDPGCGLDDEGITYWDWPSALSSSLDISPNRSDDEQHGTSTVGTTPPPERLKTKVCDDSHSVDLSPGGRSVEQIVQEYDAAAIASNRFSDGPSSRIAMPSQIRDFASYTSEHHESSFAINDQWNAQAAHRTMSPALCRALQVFHDPLRVAIDPQRNIGSQSRVTRPSQTHSPQTRQHDELPTYTQGIEERPLGNAIQRYSYSGLTNLNWPLRQPQATRNMREAISLRDREQKRQSMNSEASDDMLVEHWGNSNPSTPENIRPEPNSPQSGGHGDNAGRIVWWRKLISPLRQGNLTAGNCAGEASRDRGRHYRTETRDTKETSLSLLTRFLEIVNEELFISPGGHPVRSNSMSGGSDIEISPLDLDEFSSNDESVSTIAESEVNDPFDTGPSIIQNQAPAAPENVTQVQQQHISAPRSPTHHDRVMSWATNVEFLGTCRRVAVFTRPNSPDFIDHRFSTDSESEEHFNDGSRRLRYHKRYCSFERDHKTQLQESGYDGYKPCHNSPMLEEITHPIEAEDYTVMAMASRSPSTAAQDLSISSRDLKREDSAKQGQANQEINLSCNSSPQSVRRGTTTCSNADQAGGSEEVPAQPEELLPIVSEHSTRSGDLRGDTMRHPTGDVPRAGRIGRNSNLALVGTWIHELEETHMLPRSEMQDERRRRRKARPEELYAMQPSSELANREPATLTVDLPHLSGRTHTDLLPGNPGENVSVERRTEWHRLRGAHIQGIMNTTVPINGVRGNCIECKNPALQASDPGLTRSRCTEHGENIDPDRISSTDITDLKDQSLTTPDHVPERPKSRGDDTTSTGSVEEQHNFPPSLSPDGSG